MSIKPSIIDTFDTMFKTLKKTGLTDKDIYKLIQSRTFPQQTLKNIEFTIIGIRKLDRELKDRRMIK